MRDRIPLAELEITEGWKLSNLRTVEDHDEARVTLTRAIASIDEQLEEFDRDTELGAEIRDDDAEWQRKARAARRIKSTILDIVLSRRAELARRQRQQVESAKDAALLAIIKVNHPAAFAEALNQLPRDVAALGLRE